MRFEAGYFYWNRGEGAQITRNFHAREFECRCGKCKPQLIALELVARLQVLRDWVGLPFTVTSGFRCPAHQTALSKSGLETAKSTSTHELGDAADIALMEPDVWVQDAARVFSAIGIASNFMHVDLRRDKRRRWGYRQTRNAEDLSVTN
jgi:uncharacterized protein YcbK (DUF882 family)